VALFPGKASSVMGHLTINSLNTPTRKFHGSKFMFSLITFEFFSLLTSQNQIDVYLLNKSIPSFLEGYMRQKKATIDLLGKKIFGNEHLCNFGKVTEF
jgi:hypothetical protein